jgi:deoxyribodipyrimidine photo-lyase
MVLPKPKQRVELFFKNPADLRERVRFLKSQYGIGAFNLVNKNQQDALQEWVTCIREELPEADICVHYSLKYNKIARKGPEANAARFQAFAEECRANEILVISGGGKKTMAWNTVTALQAVQGQVPDDKQVAVAYNPYFPDDRDQLEETKRLEQKLDGKVVSKVYLQFGTDLNRLKQALEMLQTKNNAVSIAGSLFLPTAKLIGQQKFRPWNGVFLSPDFLSGPENAEAIVLEMMKLYQTYNVEMLWEAPGIRTEKDMAVVQNLIKSLDASSDESEGSAEVPIKEDEQSSFEGMHKVPQENGPSFEETPASKRPKLDRMPEPCILLFGSHDVRLRDNRAVELATQRHKTIVPVFLWSKQGTWGVRGALEVILKAALKSLESSLKSFGLDLICRNCDGDGTKELGDIIKQTGATSVYWNRAHTTESRLLERSRMEAMEALGVHVHDTQSSLLYDPEKIELDSGFHGGHWGTLMPFLKNCKKDHGVPPRPTKYHDTFRLLQESNAPAAKPDHVSVDGLAMAVVRGKDKWDEPIRKRFSMSESAALEDLETFFQKGLRRYESERSRSDKEFATSKLSPHLRIGTISPNELYWRTEESGLRYDELKTFSRRLFWRDLAYYQLKCFPDMRNIPIRKHYQNMEWVTGEEEKRRFEAWKWGKTGFPIVDAGMRELYATGWMTQTVRMVVASFLVEYLRVNWVKGCEWFHYTLVDADPAINAMMWQNAGKSGTDQWNFVLSPVTASQDPTGDYTRKWVPELAALPTTALVHRPWEAPEEVMERMGVILGQTYPHRIIQNLKAEREIAIQHTLDMRRRSQSANTDRGYDLIRLPDGKETAVFTKKEYRIDQEGNLLNESPSNKAPSKQKAKPGRKRR